MNWHEKAHPLKAIASFSRQLVEIYLAAIYDKSEQENISNQGWKKLFAVLNPDSSPFHIL